MKLVLLVLHVEFEAFLKRSKRNRSLRRISNYTCHFFSEKYQMIHILLNFRKKYLVEDAIEVKVKVGNSWPVSNDCMLAVVGNQA